MLNAHNFRLMIIILQCSLFTIVLGEQLQFITTQFAYSATNSTQPLRLNGPVNSIQYSSEGNAMWIVSGRWRMQVNFDNTGTVPVDIKQINITLIAVPADGSQTERYELSEFKQDSISYDNRTNTATIKGKFTMTSNLPAGDIQADLKLINKNILKIALDPSKTRDDLGETPIYGIER